MLSWSRDLVAFRLPSGLGCEPWKPGVLPDLVRAEDAPIYTIERLIILGRVEVMIFRNRCSKTMATSAQAFGHSFRKKHHIYIMATSER